MTYLATCQDCHANFDWETEGYSDYDGEWCPKCFHVRRMSWLAYNAVDTMMWEKHVPSHVSLYA
jgi:hypothetical protein